MRKQAYLFLKRSMDIFGALFGLIFLSPLFLAVALLVRHKLGSPVIFRQERAGKDGKPFTIYKFRTMTDERDEKGNLLPDEKRLTKFGILLRQTRVDEIPELLGILTGELSIVGPRPLLISSLGLLSEFGKGRLKMRPGMTGWAQINGNTQLTIQEKEALDMWYVDHANLILDIRIIFKTIWVVFFGEKRDERKIREAFEHAQCSDRGCW